MSDSTRSPLVSCDSALDGQHPQSPDTADSGEVDQKAITGGDGTAQAASGERRRTVRRLEPDGSRSATAEAIETMDDDIQGTEHSGEDADEPRPDRGFTYVEVVITIVLMGIVVLPVLTAVRSSIQAASVSRDAAEVETVLVNAADRVNRADRDLFDQYKCDLSGPAKKAASVHGWDDSTVAVEHFHWDDGTEAFESGACPGGQDQAVQMIRIRVTSPNDGVTRELEVVKGDF